ncbi:MAG: DedA family protein [Phenylobacterium sp.]|uniref:DedA family protein n=1 Tax=Phenylobacterium sp. TaxID=1871053 RepID=UPI002732DD27|nr:DedA family protein [Phenylobacterium sp.]MDP1640780.1 DedA family protein [Phenylobacterium sp.]MDP3116540.1 DedA family protein [Phenylobacterium sp.]
MEAMLEPVAEFIRNNSAWAGLVLGLFIMLESLVIVGALVPATPLLVLTGGLLATGVLDPVSVLIGCIVGAIVGDAISFFIGRKLGMQVLRHRWLRRYRRQFALTRLYCRRYGVISIYAGRFIGPMRAFVPAVVGMLRMPVRDFQIANVISAVVWVFAALAPGYLTAKGLEQLDIFDQFDPLTLGLIALVVAGGVGTIGWRLLRKRAKRRAPILDVPGL